MLKLFKVLVGVRQHMTIFWWGPYHTVPTAEESHEIRWDLSIRYSVEFTSIHLYRDVL